jgi:excisionase family DNA binding protein
LEIANNLKTQVEIEIAELQLEAAKETETTVEPLDSKLGDTAASKEDNSTAKPGIADERMNLKEVAKYLRMSESTIYHWVLEGKIPYYQPTGGGKYYFLKDELDKWIKGCKPKTPIAEKIKTVPEKGTKKKHHFTFKISLEPFTDVFVQEGYLDKENASLMNDRFSKEPKLGSEYIIEWKKDLKSLMTFIFLADRLGFIDK